MTYPAFRKIPRFNRDVVITEKIDGTNALIQVTSLANAPLWSVPGEHYVAVHNGPDDVEHFELRAGSRNRWLTPEADNFGFAAWVRDNASELVKLGEGLHYGEWYGQGIQRGYGLSEKRFALFNSARWSDDSIRPSCCDVVPVLLQGNMDVLLAPDTYYVGHGFYLPETGLTNMMYNLRQNGSAIAPGFMRPEGIVIYHTAARQLFKVLLEGDDTPKGVAA